jgi:hypothetical protein
MQEITRRRFISMAGSITTGLALILSSPEPLSNSHVNAEEPKKSGPLVEILDDRYKFEILAEGLFWPEGLVVNPQDNRLFFVQRTGTGGSEGIYEIVDGKAEYRFPGARDPWGQIQETKIAINDRNELFVYSRTYLDEYLRVWNTKTNKQLLEIKSPSTDDKGNDEKICEMAVNPKDGKLYVMRISGGSVDVLDRRKRKVVPCIKEGPPDLSRFYFDSDGNLYAPVYKKGLMKFSPGQKTQEVKEPTIVGVSNNTKSNPITYWSLGKRLISGRVCFMTGDFYEGFERDDPRVKDLDISTSNYLIECLEGKQLKCYEVFYSVDQEKNEARPLIRMNNYRYRSKGSCLDSHGNLYFPIYSWGDMCNKYPGQIVKMSKK